MNATQLFEQIQKKKSYLCVGLDTDINKIPDCVKKEFSPVYAFNKEIIDATAPYTIAYKPNIAFYEALGSVGWQALEMTIAYIRSYYPDIFIIADAKRGDIGNTSRMYATAFLEKLNCDAVTVAPYMGEDSVKPFIAYPNKWIVLLALTSNKGADDFQYITDRDNGMRLFENVILTSQNWGNASNMMYVVGATRADMLQDIRKLIPNHFLLVPGVGAQGGSLEEVARYGMNSQCGLIVNSSRGIIYADATSRFAEVASQKAHEMATAMALTLKNLPVR